MLAQTLDDAAVIALIPGMVLVMRRTGLPARFGTAAAVVSGVLLVCLVDLAGGAAEASLATVAGWVLTGLIDGLAAAGLTRLAPLSDSTRRRPEPDDRDRQGTGSW